MGDEKLTSWHGTSQFGGGRSEWFWNILNPSERWKVAWSVRYPTCQQQYPVAALLSFPSSLPSSYWNRLLMVSIASVRSEPLLSGYWQAKAKPGGEAESGWSPHSDFRKWHQWIFSWRCQPYRAWCKHPSIWFSDWYSISFPSSDLPLRSR